VELVTKDDPIALNTQRGETSTIGRGKGKLGTIPNTLACLNEEDCWVLHPEKWPKIMTLTRISLTGGMEQSVH
jgi:hypothetical protein